MPEGIGSTPDLGPEMDPAPIEEGAHFYEGNGTPYKQLAPEIGLHVIPIVDVVGHMYVIEMRRYFDKRHPSGSNRPKGRSLQIPNQTRAR